MSLWNAHFNGKLWKKKRWVNWLRWEIKLQCDSFSDCGATTLSFVVSLGNWSIPVGSRVSLTGPTTFPYSQFCLWAARCSCLLRCRRFRRCSPEVCGGRWSRRTPASGCCSKLPAARTTIAPGPPPAPPSFWTLPGPHPKTHKEVGSTIKPSFIQRVFNGYEL